MAKLRHIAITSKDPWATALFYMEAFGMKKVGEVDTSFVLGVYLSDGVINMAILKFKTDGTYAGFDETCPTCRTYPTCPGFVPSSRHTSSAPITASPTSTCRCVERSSGSPAVFRSMLSFFRSAPFFTTR